MLSTLKQLILQWFLLSNITPPTHEVTIKLKRAPLEIGLISFGIVNPVKNFQNDFLNQTTPTSIGALEEPLNLPSKVALQHSRHIWIPGHVHRQSFIPAHIHHVLVSSHSQLLLAQHLHTLLLKPSEKQFKVYNDLSPVGGFGVGYDFGGTGAGHGFQVSF